MSQIILCKGKRAKTPYRFASEGLGIYSLEELCYVTIHYEELPREELYCTEICDWIRTELEMPELAGGLQKALQEKGRHSEAFLTTLFRYSGYATSKEIAQTITKAKQLEQLEPEERKKYYADKKLVQGRVYRAMGIYRELLEELPRETGKDLNLVGRILHNLGTAYAQMFLFATAADYFKQAYETSHMEASKNGYERALYLMNADKEDLIERKEISLGKLKEIAQLEERLLNEPQYQERMEQIEEGFALQRDEQTRLEGMRATAREWKTTYLKRIENGIVAKDFWEKAESHA